MYPAVPLPPVATRWLPSVEDATDSQLSELPYAVQVAPELAET